jgi:hypothetical protein
VPTIALISFLSCRFPYGVGGRNIIGIGHIVLWDIDHQLQKLLNLGI